MEKNQQPDALANRGYLLAADVAAKTRMHIGSVYRWCALGEVESVKLGNVRWIKITSLIDKLGVDAAKALGITAPAEE